MKISSVQQGTLGLIWRKGKIFKTTAGWCSRGALPVQNRTIDALKKLGLVAEIEIISRGFTHKAAVLTAAGREQVGVHRA